jgi:hypothetical protein
MERGRKKAEKKKELNHEKNYVPMNEEERRKKANISEKSANVEFLSSKIDDK